MPLCLDFSACLYHTELINRQGRNLNHGCKAYRGTQTKIQQESSRGNDIQSDQNMTDSDLLICTIFLPRMMTSMTMNLKKVLHRLLLIYRLFSMPAFVRALFIKSSTNVELSYYIKKKKPLTRYLLNASTASGLALFQCIIRFCKGLFAFSILP